MAKPQQQQGPDSHCTRCGSVITPAEPIPRTHCAACRATMQTKLATSCGRVLAEITGPPRPAPRVLALDLLPIAERAEVSDAVDDLFDAIYTLRRERLNARLRGEHVDDNLVLETLRSIVRANGIN